ncbi:MAG: threonyl-tRNA synthetase editing domain-containing protein, partial [Nitrososphaeria archaeon]
MKILQLHTDYIGFKLIKKEIEAAEDCELKEFKYDNIVVLFTSVEEGDDESVVLKAVEDVKNSLTLLGVNKVLIYPFAHLSSNLANPFEAYKVLKFMEECAKVSGIETYRAPFGWNKQFTLSIKGHPLAEQFKSISKEEALEEKVPQALKAEEKIKSYWYIITVDGELVPVEKFDFKGHGNLE